jgi:hypothetical protein
MPDPVRAGASRIILFVRAKEMPKGIPLDPNPRAQNINKSVYKDVLASLLNRECEPDAFHLKNKGITAIASTVAKVDGHEDSYLVEFEPGQGIVDGGHTYQIVLEGQRDPTLSDSQFVKVELLLGLPGGLATEIAGGLNTAVQVQDMSLDNLGGLFDWVQAAIPGEPYESAIAYRENEADKQLDVRTVVALLTLFNIALYPNDGAEYPIAAYSSKAAVLNQFRSNQESFKRLTKILPDILELSDLVSFNARDLHNEMGGKAGRLAFMETRKTGEFRFPFIQASSKYRLTNGALYPMLGAFRWMVELGPDGLYAWKGSFADVKHLWETAGSELMRVTQSTSDELGRNPNAIGKSRNHWSTMHSVLIKKQLMGGQPQSP